jgi:hypothetical protein
MNIIDIMKVLLLFLLVGGFLNVFKSTILSYTENNKDFIDCLFGFNIVNGNIVFFKTRNIPYYKNEEGVYQVPKEVLDKRKKVEISH